MCNKSFKLKKHLKNHILLYCAKQVVDTEEHWFMCRVCNKSFSCKNHHQNIVGDLMYVKYVVWLEAHQICRQAAHSCSSNYIVWLCIRAFCNVIQSLLHAQWNEVSVFALGQDIGCVCCHRLPFLYSILRPWPSHTNSKTHMNMVHFERTSFLYEGNSLSESKRIHFNMTVQLVCILPRSETEQFCRIVCTDVNSEL